MCWGSRVSVLWVQLVLSLLCAGRSLSSAPMASILEVVFQLLDFLLFMFK